MFKPKASNTGRPTRGQETSWTVTRNLRLRRTNTKPWRILSSVSTHTMLVHGRHDSFPFTNAAAISNTRGQSNFSAEISVPVPFSARRVCLSIIFSSVPLSTHRWPRHRLKKYFVKHYGRLIRGVILSGQWILPYKLIFPAGTRFTLV